MKSNSSPRRVRPLRAKAAVAHDSSLEDYELEPNMKLSHAFLVVLALHVIAVGGLFAFNKVKAHQALPSVKKENVLESTAATHSKAGSITSQGVEKSASPVLANVTTTTPLHAATAPDPTPVASPTVPTPTTPISSTGGGSGVPPTPSPTPTPPVVAPPAPATSPLSASETPSTTAVSEYTVVKGDNPYNIAKRFHVSYDSLMKLNNITDPRKIQIGQKLQIPAPLPTATPKTSSSVSHKASTVASHKAAKKKVKKKS